MRTGWWYAEMATVLGIAAWVVVYHGWGFGLAVGYLGYVLADMRDEERP